MVNSPELIFPGKSAVVVSSLVASGTGSQSHGGGSNSGRGVIKSSISKLL